MALKVYVAGSSAERAEVSRYIRALESAGVEITLDWCAAIEAAGGKANEGLTDEQRHKYAEDDLDAVLAADVVWIMVPSTPSIGAWVEFGFAFGSGARTIVSGDHRKTIFCALADIEKDTHDEALAWIVKEARGS